MLTTKIVTKKVEDYQQIINIYNQAFPKEERVPMELLLLLSKRKIIQFLAFYDNKQLCGIAYLGQDMEHTFVLYLAVATTRRSEGYGSKILDWIQANSPSRRVSLNMEIVSEAYDNYDQRVKRFEFYQKNGFLDTGKTVLVKKGVYTILANHANFSAEEYTKLWHDASFGFYHPKFI